MSERCVWCGALAVRDAGGDVGWVLTMAQAGCEHELLDPDRWPDSP